MGRLSVPASQTINGDSGRMRILRRIEASGPKRSDRLDKSGSNSWRHVMVNNARLIRSSELFPGVPYAYAATAPIDARMVYIAGACPLNSDGTIAAVGDIHGQTRKCLENMHSALRAAGAEITDVVFTRVLVASTQQEDLGAAWDVVHREFGEHDVPSTLFGVTVLGWDDQLVEIEAIAAVR
jgi:enamine deaminase RidA (YjgF/YER057c/UK114 family)